MLPYRTDSRFRYFLTALILTLCVSSQGLSDEKEDGLDKKAEVAKEAEQPKVESKKEDETPADSTPAQVDKDEEVQSAPQPLFPDKALEAAVRAVVFDKRFNQDPLTKDDVAKIPHVIGRGKGIKSLEGLQHCVSLMKIDLEDNEISDLKPISELNKLISLSLAGNKIQEISAVKSMVNLQLLDLSRNNIKKIDPVAGMKNLRDLWIADNQISDLTPISNLPKIWYLDIAKNKVVDLTVVGKLKWLTTLDITDNQVKDLSALRSLSDLDLLLISKNQIADLGPLAEMCAADSAGERRFAPYLEVYLGENPIDDGKKTEWINQLKSAGVDVFEK